MRDFRGLTSRQVGGAPLGALLRGTSAMGALALALGATGTAHAHSESIATASAPVILQDDAAAAGEGEDEELVVTGFRASLRNAINEKRNSATQIDAITAEDIADFPDANLAESLQRLPGVSIDRDNGEGRSITVRGLGGDFNRTRLNGLEALSTAGSNDAGSSPNRSRSFDYSTFASELFNSLKVQKTPSADTDEGSLGATIDLQTARPFDYKGFTLGVSAEGSYQENSKKWNPRIAGLVSTKSSDGSMGILFSGAYSKSKNEIDQYRRPAGQSDYLYRNAAFAGNENPQRGGFSAPTGTTLTGVTNPDAIAAMTGSDPAAYAKLYPGAPYNTPGRFDDSLVRIPALASIEQQDVETERLGVTASYQWQIGPDTLLSVDGVYSRLHNKSTYYQVSSVGLNRDNTNANYNTANSATSIATARGLYPGLCTFNAGSDIVPFQDCGESLYGTTPAFATARNASNVVVPAVYGTNIFSSNPNNLDPYDYYNNPNSVGYIPNNNRLAFRDTLIGRQGVDVLDANVRNGLADYLVLRNVDFRSAADQSEYTTKFKQYSFNLEHAFSDTFKAQLIAGKSESTNETQGLLVEFNRMDSPGSFVYDERGGGKMPKIDFGFDAANPANWETVKGFSAIRHYQRFVKNTYQQAKLDFDWQINDEVNLAFGGNYREYGFETSLGERNTDTINPTLKEAKATTASVSKVIQFGQGLSLPAGTMTSFIAPSIEGFNNLLDFTCNCINKWGDWRLTTKRNGGRENFSVTEKDTGLYFQLDFNSELFGRPFRGNAGTRVAITDLTSTGNSTAGRAIVGKNKYTDWLPSTNLVYEPIDDVLVRLGVSRVMARPLLGNLSPTLTGISVPNVAGAVSGGTFTIGNPQLKPFRSTNLDASVEWYFAPGGLVSLAAFHKKISSFPQTVNYSARLGDFLDAAGIAAIRAGFTNAAQLAYIDGNNEFTARQFRDAPGGYLRGIEASFQMDFTFLPWAFKYLGAQVNYTYIESELEYILDPGTRSAANPTGTLPTTGKGPFLNVSPQALNGTLYFEMPKFSARVSVAHRKEYSTAYPIASGACGPGIVPPAPATPATIGANNQPGGLCTGPLINDFTYSRPTTNVDARIAYEVNDWFSVSIEGLNLTNQTSDRYAYAGQNAVTQYASSGAIYRAGAKVRF
jgi:iron complex outermembrane receptor protein